MEFKERTKAPAKSNKNYYSKENLFYPTYTNQCTWYCWGRQLELGISEKDLKKNLPTSNAENWAHDTKYPVYQFPRVGDILCYKAGKYHHAADGEGHVATVEKVYDNGDIDISESGATMKFQYRKVKKPYKFYLNFKHAKNYKFDGFIHLQDYDSKWIIGDYITLKQKYVRKSPKVDGSKNKVKYNTLLSGTKAKCNKTANGYARYKKGVIVYLTEFKYDDKGNLWGRENNYWLCVNDSSGDQVKKI